MTKTQTRNGIKRVSENVRSWYPVTDYRDAVAEMAAVETGFLSLADAIEMQRAREAA